MMADRCVIITGGNEEPIGGVSGAFVIGCDKGCLYAQKQGIVPDLCVGDFDSYGGPLPEGVKTVRLPSEKDDTDTGYAVKYALGLGFKKITVRCAVGGRPRGGRSDGPAARGVFPLRLRRVRRGAGSHGKRDEIRDGARDAHGLVPSRSEQRMGGGRGDGLGRFGNAADNHVKKGKMKKYGVLRRKY